MTVSRRVAGALLLLYLLTGAVVVLWPTQEFTTPFMTHAWDVVHELGAPAWVSGGEIGFAANVLLFMPLSFLGHALRPRWRWGQWVLAGLLGSSMIELTQRLLLSGRQPSGVDITANTLGALAGYVLAMILLRNRASAARRR